MSRNAIATEQPTLMPSSTCQDDYFDAEGGCEVSNTKISSKESTDMDYSQWQVGPNGKYRAAARTVANLPSGVYKIEQDDAGLYLQLQNVISDNIVELPETANTHVLKGMKTFWTRKNRYEKFGFVYKRGVLLWGPPGSGKSVTINLLMKELISLNGIVLLCGHPEFLAHMLQRIRQMEPDRPIIVVLEDIDEIVEKHGEHSILSMLDGENQIANVVYLACPAPETKILKADLTWVRADSLKTGDKLIAFDENGPFRKYRTSIVNSAPISERIRYKVTTDSGSTIVSEDHPFLIKLGNRPYEWRSVQDLRAGNKIAYLCAPWETDSSREGGYLAGQYDGEGSLNFSRNQHGSLSFRVGWGQVRGPIAKDMKHLLKTHGFSVAQFNKKQTQGKYIPNKPQLSYTIAGGKWENLRLLGTIRPSRLLADPRLSDAWENNRLCADFTKVISIKCIGKGPVVALDTTTNTFIGEGMLQHNTTNYPERLGARIVNRPSRFDERIFVGMPSEAARKTYLQFATKEFVKQEGGTPLSEEELDKWVSDTENFSIAHLRELVAAVYCLDQEYKVTLKRLKSMTDKPKFVDGFRKGNAGFSDDEEPKKENN